MGLRLFNRTRAYSTWSLALLFAAGLLVGELRRPLWQWVSAQWAEPEHDVEPTIAPNVQLQRKVERLRYERDDLLATLAALSDNNCPHSAKVIGAPTPNTPAAQPPPAQVAALSGGAPWKDRYAELLKAQAGLKQEIEALTKYRGAPSHASAACREIADGMKRTWLRLAFLKGIVDDVARTEPVGLPPMQRISVILNEPIGQLTNTIYPLLPMVNALRDASPSGLDSTPAVHHPPSGDKLNLALKQQDAALHRFMEVVQRQLSVPLPVVSCEPTPNKETDTLNAVPIEAWLRYFLINQRLDCLLNQALQFEQGPCCAEC